MRSPKNRSRSKPNRNRTLGNVINRVFDSSGPEGKVRGTPQQIIDKYNQLTRDAQLSNDRVAAENFQQHAEHYLRLLAEAMREQEARREQSEREPRWTQPDRSDRQGGRNEGEGGSTQSAPEPAPAPAPDEGSDTMLVVTPEGATEQNAQPAVGATAEPVSPSQDGAGEVPQKKPTRTRSPRAPRSGPRSTPRKKAADSDGAEPAPVIGSTPPEGF